MAEINGPDNYVAEIVNTVRSPLAALQNAANGRQIQQFRDLPFFCASTAFAAGMLPREDGEGLPPGVVI